MRLIFLGPPGAGKGTQARLLEERFGAKQISTGDILRENRAKGTSLGKEAEDYMHRGELVPDGLIISMIEDELEKYPAGFIMDGFPRNVAQAEAFAALLARKGWKLDGVVQFEVDRETLIDRLSARWTNPRSGRTYNSISNAPRVAGVCDEDGGALVQREDDKPETVAHRLDVYERETRPLTEYYKKKGILVEIDALQPVEEVTHELVHAVKMEHAH